MKKIKAHHTTHCAEHTDMPKIFTSAFRTRRGFTLIELMVAVALFAIVMTISVGSLLSLVEADRKAQALKSVMNNLNFALENMSRNLRVGTDYHCSESAVVPPNVSSPNNCPTGGVLIGFEETGGNPASPTDQVIYRFVGNSIEKSSDGGATFIAITAPEVTIEDVRFYVVGTTRGDTNQPRILMTVSGFAGIGERILTTFNLQSTVSQRVLDL